ncbi:MAG: HlyD family type I secretion periplasmic adaptor subunit [Alphaproteobacteria bacterium]|nr:HlyD family type I secretion periplasmic adaptor subunit [Alphaproteobacteria bacterium]
MTKLDDLMERNPVPGWRVLAYLVIFLLVSGIGWANFTELEEVAVAQGVVVPAGQIKTVQHLEGGIVQAINVKEGDKVTEGQELLQLVLGAQNLNVEEIEARIDGLTLQRARLEAEANGEDLHLPLDIAARQRDIANSERRTYAGRLNELNSTLRGLEGQVTERELEVKEFQAQQGSLERELGRLGEKFNISEGLLKDGLTTRVEHLEIEQEIEKLKGQIEVIQVAVPRTRAALEGARERLKEESLKFRSAANGELGKIDQELSRARQQLLQASRQADRTFIASPIDGVIKKLYVNTLGGVVAPGEIIMEIVPSGQALLIEAKLDPKERGFVEEGLPALVKVSTYDFVRYGGLEGRVSLIAPDATVDEKGNSFYRVVIETDKNYLGSSESEFPILPGMVASVDIKTGTRSVAEFLIRPVLKLRSEGFRER